MEKLTFTVNELAHALSIGHNAAYDLCHRQDFPASRIGGRIIIPVEGLRKWLDDQATKGCDAE